MKVRALSVKVVPGVYFNDRAHGRRPRRIPQLSPARCYPMTHTPHHSPPPHRPHHPSQSMPENKPSQMAWAALFCGVGAWTLLPAVAAIAAVICGHIERGHIRRGESPSAGLTVATVGMILGYIQLGLVALGIFAMVVIFGLMALGIAVL
ncbi:DUF4190 domain-containing protein [Lujinxingia vulgaris]|uniref:DUF4190 domain-containing protein n=2 Tax=Lujinxingia vulgaris TaxID=2600176 RepID=A0A5C6X642_9DELT|nr:DUF4190 domain-containing protein [Lujinxingia vulgaris]